MMMVSNSYILALKNHYETYFGLTGLMKVWSEDPHHKLYPEFYVLEFGPNKRHKMITYCTVGMSMNRNDHNLIELFIFSPRKDDSIIELLTVIASDHIKDSPLNIHHTFNIGRPWLDDSICEFGFISLPYLHGEELELFKFNDKIIHCYWVIPITETEKQYKTEKGYEALEDLFEERRIEYLNPKRTSLA